MCIRDRPLTVIRGEKGVTPLTVEGELMLEAIKVAEDDNSLVFRFFEFQNKRGKCKLTFNRPVLEAWKTNLLEEPTEGVKSEGRTVIFTYSNREIVSLKVKLG